MIISSPNLHLLRLIIQEPTHLYYIRRGQVALTNPSCGSGRLCGLVVGDMWTGVGAAP